MIKHETISYLELPANNLPATKQFFETVFGWQFEDYGDTYSAFSVEQAGLNGGFYQAKMHSSTKNGAALIVFYSNDLHATQVKIERAGGLIVQPIFPFPGGQRFHFTEPSGNEFAVWSKLQTATQSNHVA